ncbi:hypothetical protein ACIBKY_52990 [Nonomuraea sp. NPDC050394]|uniref:hypothetical protein n=1 Tax=Nonomuraea sp. NPDC050394 TaxID=3364363 RepID=UPI0037956599
MRLVHGYADRYGVRVTDAGASTAFRGRVKTALTSIGSPDAMPYLRADVNDFGAGFVI